MIQVDGPPVGGIRWEPTNIREGGVEDSLFELPSDYRKINKSAQGFCGAGICTVSSY